MLEVKDISASKDGQTLFRGVSFTVADGEAAAVSGDQGGSLTLLLHAIMGLYPLDEGHVSIDGELLTPLSAGEFRKLMAYIPTETPQTGGTVEALLRLPFGLEANRAKPFSRQSLLEEWRLLGLDEGVLRQRVADISAQERQLAMLSLPAFWPNPSSWWTVWRRWPGQTPRLWQPTTCSGSPGAALRWWQWPAAARFPPGLKSTSALAFRRILTASVTPSGGIRHQKLHLLYIVLYQSR